MSRLIILGNGFDLYYGLPTKYQDDLVPILKRNDKEFFNIVDSLYFKKDLEFWRDFEAEIGVIKDDDILHKKFSDDLNEVFEVQPENYSLESERYGDVSISEYDAANQASELTPNFKSAFEENNAEFLNNAFSFLEEGLKEMCYNAEGKLKEKLDKNQIKRDFNFRNDDLFITFNYTNTLEQVYEFISEEDICHLHESVENGAVLIFGNSQEKIISAFCDFSEENPYFDSNFNDEDESDSYMTYREKVTLADQDFNEYNDAANKILDEFNKKFEKKIQMDNLEEFLSDKDINEIWVFGTSFGDVDIPYYRYIKSKYPHAKWYISYYEEEEYPGILTTMAPLLGSNVDYLRADDFLNKL